MSLLRMIEMKHLKVFAIAGLVIKVLGLGKTLLLLLGGAAGYAIAHHELQKEESEA